MGLSPDTTVQTNPSEPSNSGVKLLLMDANDAFRALIRDKPCIPMPQQNSNSADQQPIGLEAAETAPSIKDDSSLGLPEENLPDFIVRKHVGPLVWVKIPKGFAGVWETRKRLCQEIDLDKSGKPQYRERPLSVNEVVRLDWLYDRWYHESSFMLNYGILSIESNQYRFIRGMQKDEEGNVWDCPNLRNVEFHKISDNSLCSNCPAYMRAVIVYHRIEEIVSDEELVEQITYNSRQERVDRHLLSDSFVDAQSSPIDSSEHPNYLKIHYLPEFKVADFKPIDSWRGIDLKASFESFRKNLR